MRVLVPPPPPLQVVCLCDTVFMGDFLFSRGERKWPESPRAATGYCIMLVYSERQVISWLGSAPYRLATASFTDEQRKKLMFASFTFSEKQFLIVSGGLVKLQIKFKNKIHNLILAEFCEILDGRSQKLKTVIVILLIKNDKYW